MELLDADEMYRKKKKTSINKILHLEEEEIKR